MAWDAPAETDQDHPRPWWRDVAAWRRRLRTLWRPEVAVLPVPAMGLGDAASAASVARSVAAFRAWAQRHAGASVELSLSGSGLLCCATPEARAPDEADEQACAQWMHYLGLTPEQLDADWARVAVVRPGVRLVWAVPRALAEGVMAEAEAHGVRLRSLQPWWGRDLLARSAMPAATSNSAQPDGAVSSWTWSEPDAHVQALAQRDEGPWRLQQLWMDHGAPPPDAVQALSLVPAGEAQALADTATVLQGPLVAQAWVGSDDAFNALGERVRPGFWGWALLALGLLAGLHQLDGLNELQVQQQAAQQVLHRLSRGTQQQSLHAQVQARATEAQTSQAPALADADWPRAAQLALWLGHPWADLLDHVDDSAHQTQTVLLGFSLDLATLGEPAQAAPELRLQAAVLDDARTLKWAEALGPQTQWRTREPLSQRFHTGAGEYATRVVLVTRGGQR